MKNDREPAEESAAETEKPQLTTGGSAAEERVRAAEAEEGRRPQRAGASRDRP
jgi:hypothetical protein